MAFTLVALPVATLAVAPSASAQENGSISGTVTNTRGTGVANECVAATPNGPTGGGGALAWFTASDGTYTLNNVPPGTYEVQFYAGCGAIYANQVYENQPAQDIAQATVVTVNAGQNTPNINDVLQPGGDIAGSVVDANGHPLSGVCVDAITTTGTSFAGALTDTNGDFGSNSAGLVGLPTGSYDILFSSTCDGTGPFATQWYAGVSRQRHATAVIVTAGQVTTGIDAVMAPSPLIRVSLTAPQSTIAVGGSEQFQATGAYANGQTADITNSVSWSSTKTQSAAISGSGMVTGIASGTTKIKASMPEIPGSTRLKTGRLPLQVS